MNLKRAISLIFFLSGVILVFYSIQNNGSQTDKRQYLGHLDRADHKIDMALLEKKINFNRDQEVILLFVIDDEFCSSCINEIQEYMQVVTKYINSSLNQYIVKRHAFVVGSSKEGLERVHHLLEIPFASSSIIENSKFIKDVKKWSIGISGINQIILIDINKEKVVSRIGIFSSSTKPYFKRNVVDEAFYQLEL